MDGQAIQDQPTAEPIQGYIPGNYKKRLVYKLFKFESQDEDPASEVFGDLFEEQHEEESKIHKLTDEHQKLLISTLTIYCNSTKIKYDEAYTTI